MTKSLTLAAALSLSAFAFSAAPALAQEGNGNPFPLRTPGVTTIVTAQSVPDVGSAAYPDVRGRPGSALFAFSEPVVGSSNEAPVQTANSLPDNFTAGTELYASVPNRNRFAVPSALASRN